MKIRVPRFVVERILGRKVEEGLVRFYFDPAIQTSYVKKEGLYYKVVFGRSGDLKNTIEHELTHVRLGHVEKRKELLESGMDAFTVNIFLDLEVEAYLRSRGLNSAPQFSDDQIRGFYKKVEPLIA